MRLEKPKPQYDPPLSHNMFTAHKASKFYLYLHCNNNPNPSTEDSLLK